MILVTGGAGFIGANFILDWLSDSGAEGIINLDKLTYAGNLATLDSLKADTRHLFVRGDISDKELVAKLLKEHQPRAIVNFAACEPCKYLLFNLYFLTERYLQIKRKRLSLSLNEETVLFAIENEIWITVNAYRIKKGYIDIDEKRLPDFIRAFLQQVQEGGEKEYEYYFPCGS